MRNRSEKYWQFNYFAGPRQYRAVRNVYSVHFHERGEQQAGSKYVQ
jgi:hypothetical protein